MGTNASLDHYDRDRMQNFESLDRQQQAQAIKNMAASGVGDHGIASATKLSVEAVRRVIGEKP
jgi:hypothetical protein